MKYKVIGYIDYSKNKNTKDRKENDRERNNNTKEKISI